MVRPLPPGPGFACGTSVLGDCAARPPPQVVVAFSFRSDDLFTFNHVEGVEL